jgi:hypothetical protein
MEKVFDEVLYPEELILKKMNNVAVTPSDKTGHTFQPDYEEPIQVVQEFDPYLKFVTFTVRRDPEDEDVNYNIHTPPPLKSAYQNSCNKVPVKFSEEAPRFTGELFC